MKTDTLISLLAADEHPVPRSAAARRLGWALAAGLPLSAAVMAFEYGVRRDLMQVAQLPMFWVKLIFPLAIAVAAFMAAQRLARPGVPAGRGVGLALGLPVVALWLLAIGVWFTTPEADRAPMLWGTTWRSCAFSIGLIALPVFVAALLSLRSMAPTRPALAGAAAGALASGTGAAVYALHCPELAAPFLAVWYVAGMAMPVALGALLGPRLLRW